MFADTADVRSGSRRGAAGAVTLVMAVMLAGCGVTLQADRVALDNPAALQVPGVYYALPRTELQVSWSARVSQAHGGGFKDFEACVSHCRAVAPERRASEMPCPCTATPSAAWQHELLAASIQGVPRPDPKHLYRLNASADNWLATVNHALKLSDFGTLASLDTSATEGVSDWVANVASAALRIVPLRAGNEGLETRAGQRDAAPAMSSLQGTPKTGQRAQQGGEAKQPASACSVAAGVDRAMGLDFDLRMAQRLVNNTLNSLTQAKPISLSCLQVECITSVLDRLTQQVRVLEALQLTSIRSAQSPEQAQLAAQWVGQQIQAAAASRQALEAGLMLQPAAAPAKVVATWSDTPFFPEAKEDMPRRDLSQWSLQPDTGPAIQCAAPGGQGIPARFAQLCTALSQQKLVVQATDKDLAGAAKAQAQPSAGGYRYRIPAWAEVRIHQGSDNGSVLARQSLPVAQFGPIVALPAHYSGRKAALNFELNDQGALRSIQLGQEAQSGAALGSLADAVEERRGRRAERAEAAQSAPLQNATRDNDLQVQSIRALQLQRCAEALRTLPPDAPMPAICP